MFERLRGASMDVVFIVYALIILYVFNLLIQKYCLKLELEKAKQTIVFRFTNIMILILLVSSYIKVLNSIGWG